MSWHVAELWWIVHQLNGLNRCEIKAAAERLAAFLFFL